MIFNIKEKDGPKSILVFLMRSPKVIIVVG